MTQVEISQLTTDIIEMQINTTIYSTAIHLLKWLKCKEVVDGININQRVEKTKVIIDRLDRH